MPPARPRSTAAVHPPSTSATTPARAAAVAVTVTVARAVLGVRGVAVVVTTAGRVSLLRVVVGLVCESEMP